MLLVLHGAKLNAGDFLIRERGLEILRHLRPAQRLVVHPRWEPVDPDLFDSADAVVLCGGPGLARRFYPTGLRDGRRPGRSPDSGAAAGARLERHPGRGSRAVQVQPQERGGPASDSRADRLERRARRPVVGDRPPRGRGRGPQDRLLRLVPPAEHGPAAALRGARASPGVYAGGATPARRAARGRFPAPPPSPPLSATRSATASSSADFGRSSRPRPRPGSAWPPRRSLGGSVTGWSTRAATSTRSSCTARSIYTWATGSTPTSARSAGAARAC